MHMTNVSTTSVDEKLNWRLEHAKRTGPTKLADEFTTLLLNLSCTWIKLLMLIKIILRL